MGAIHASLAGGDNGNRDFFFRLASAGSGVGGDGDGANRIGNFDVAERCVAAAGGTASGRGDYVADVVAAAVASSW